MTGEASQVVVTAAVEGVIDEAIVSVLLNHAGAHLGPVHGRQGKPALLRRLRAYNSAARHSPWLVLIDLDKDNECAPPMRQIWLPSPEPSMIFRIAIREVEAWLLADLDAIADFLHISRDKVPRDPETLDDPKRSLVNLARGSGSREIREDLVPRDGGGRSVGPAYTARMTEFATLNWRPEEASKRSPSLRRGVLAVQRLVASAL